VAEEPNAWKSSMEKTHSYHTEKEEFVDRTSGVHQSTEWIYIYPAWTRKWTCKCQITQYSYMRNIITHTLVRATAVSTSRRARMSWLLDVGLFMVVTSQNGKMRRNRSIKTTSVYEIIWHVKSYGMSITKTKNSSYVLWKFKPIIYEPIIRQMKIHIKNFKLDLACLPN
jgi:hypothetical protein